MNVCVIVGRMATDPEGRTTQSGIQNCTFRVAVQRPFANSNGVREADFLNCVAWRQSADYILKYLHKGDSVAVNGSIQTRSYDKDGQKHYVTEIIADRVESVGSRPQNDSQRAVTSSEPVPLTGAEADELPF